MRMRNVESLWIDLKRSKAIEWFATSELLWLFSMMTLMRSMICSIWWNSQITLQSWTQEGQEYHHYKIDCFSSSKTNHTRWEVQGHSLSNLAILVMQVYQVAKTLKLSYCLKAVWLRMVRQASLEATIIQLVRLSWMSTPPVSILGKCYTSKTVLTVLEDFLALTEIWTKSSLYRSSVIRKWITLMLELVNSLWIKSRMVALESTTSDLRIESAYWVEITRWHLHRTRFIKSVVD